MPVYMYRCRSCNHEFETRQRMVDDPLKTCPSCGEDQLRRVINQVGVVFKGSGFYVTDSKGKNPAGVTTSSDSSKSDSASDTSSKSESKSETKSESKSESKSSTTSSDS